MRNVAAAAVGVRLEAGGEGAGYGLILQFRWTRERKTGVDLGRPWVWVCDVAVLEVVCSLASPQKHVQDCSVIKSTGFGFKQFCRYIVRVLHLGWYQLVEFHCPLQRPVEQHMCALVPRHLLVVGQTSLVDRNHGDLLLPEYFVCRRCALAAVF